MVGWPVGIWWAILPLRIGPGGKSRLVSEPPSRRAALARAFAQDAVSAVAGCSRIAGIVVVGDAAALEAFGDGLVTIRDSGEGLNAALRSGAAAVPTGAPCVAVMADLPCLAPDVLATALDLADSHSRAFVCDAEGIGTTTLMSRDPERLDPRFGERSRAAHAASGAIEITDKGLGRLRRDVDSEVALWDAVRIGVGPATRAALA